MTVCRSDGTMFEPLHPRCQPRACYTCQLLRITLYACGDPLLASRHRISANDDNHAVAHALVIVDLDPGSDPPKVLCIGPDRAGNLLEVIWLELADERPLVIHAMALRRIFFDLLPKSEADQ